MERALTCAAKGFGYFIAAASILPFFRCEHWLVRAWDFPRLQIAFAASLGAVGALACPRKTGPDKRMLALTAGSAVLQAIQILPYTRLARKEVMRAQGEGDLRILAANVLQQNRRTDAYHQLIQQLEPDLILLTETDGYWKSAMATLKNSYPFTVEQAQENTYGMCLYSKLELVDPEVRFLVKKDIPSIRARIRLRSGREVWFYAVHPEPPASRKKDASLRGSGPRDVELLLLAAELQRLNGPVVIAGDFNDVAWSHTTRLFKRVSGLLDPRRGRGMFNTFHADYPPLRYPLDHLFHSKHWALVDFQRLKSTGSDHFPIYVSLKLSEKAPAIQEQAPPKRSDIAEAKETIASAPVD